jgi:hypothetical protein
MNYDLLSHIGPFDFAQGKEQLNASTGHLTVEQR